MKIKTILIGCLFFCVSVLDLFCQSSRGEKAFLENNPEEAILFLESEPQSEQNLARISEFSEDVVKLVLEKLKEKFLFS